MDGITYLYSRRTQAVIIEMRKTDGKRLAMTIKTISRISLSDNWRMAGYIWYIQF